MSQQRNIKYFMCDVFQRHNMDFEVLGDELVYAAENIKTLYDPEAMKFSDSRIPVNYNDPAHRCAYLFRYAGIHAAAVWYILLRNRDDVVRMCFKPGASVNICCLGGGPGTDIVGIAAAFCSMNVSSEKIFRFTTVDCMLGWASVNNIIRDIADPGMHGELGWFLSGRASTSFICDDVFSPSQVTIEAIASADMVTMIKFVSAVPQDFAAFEMLQNVFRLMKRGAFVLFIDNSGGKSFRIAEAAATSCGLEELKIFFENIKYENPVFHQEMRGIVSRSDIKVAMKIWKKPEFYTLC